MRILAVAAMVLALALTVPARAADDAFQVGPQDMRVDLFRPPGNAMPRGLALVLHTSGGLQGADIEHAKALAAQGYTAAVPHFLAAYHISPKSRHETWTRYRAEIHADLKAAIAEAARRERLDPAAAVAVGFSNGGYWALYLAARGEVRKAVSYYGAYSEAGSDTSLDNLKAVLNAKGSPALLFHGTADSVVPIRVVHRLQKLVQESGAPVTVVVFENVDHTFERGGNASSVENEAAAQAWAKTLDFLNRR